MQINFLLFPIKTGPKGLMPNRKVGTLVTTDEIGTILLCYNLFSLLF